MFGATNEASDAWVEAKSKPKDHLRDINQN